MAHQSFSDEPLRSATARQGVLARFVLSALLTAGMVTGLSLAVPMQVSTFARALPPLSFLIVAYVAGLGLMRHYPHDRLGACNVITLIRVGLVALLTLPLAMPGLLSQQPALAWAAIVVAGLALALDGVDGHLARRSRLVSAFGARFDMEVDCALALILSVLAVQGGQGGPWLLLLGTMRYLFVAAGAVVPWLAQPLPERFGRKAVCVVQIATLVIILAPVVPPPLASLLGVVTLGALLWSFGRDILWLAARR